MLSCISPFPTRPRALCCTAWPGVSREQIVLSLAMPGSHSIGLKSAGQLAWHRLSIGHASLLKRLWAVLISCLQGRNIHFVMWWDSYIPLGQTEIFSPVFLSFIPFFISFVNCVLPLKSCRLLGTEFGFLAFISSLTLTQVAHQSWNICFCVTQTCLLLLSHQFLTVFLFHKPYFHASINHS